MIKVFKWWWEWNYEELEDWLERMEAAGLRLCKTRFGGIYFYFEKCVSTKARYCIDFQTKLTPEYLTIINDDGWQLYQIGFGWYILRKKYQEERPDLYTDFEGLITRDKILLRWIIVCLIIGFLCIGNLVWDTYSFFSIRKLAYTCIYSSLVIAFFAYNIAKLAMQISKFSKKE